MKKKTYASAEEITAAFIANGWSQSISFSELTLEEAKIEGLLFAVSGISNGRKFFRMNHNGDIYDDKGKICMFNIPCAR